MLNMNTLMQKIALLVLEETGWTPPANGASRKAASPVAARVVGAGRAAAAPAVAGAIGAPGPRVEYVPMTGLSQSIVKAQTGNNGKVLAVLAKSGRAKPLIMPTIAQRAGVIPKTVESCLYQLRSAKLIESRQRTAAAK